MKTAVRTHKIESFKKIRV